MMMMPDASFVPGTARLSLASRAYDVDYLSVSNFSKEMPAWSLSSSPAGGKQP